MAEALLSVENLSVLYGNIRAVDNVNLTAATGEITALMGANGAGKSSLLGALMGLRTGAGGEIRLGEDRLDGLAAHRRARLGIGYVPEGRRVFPGMTAHDNLLVASRDSGAARAARADDRDRPDSRCRIGSRSSVRRREASWRLLRRDR